MRRLTELYDNGYSSGDDEMKAVISGKSELEDGSALYITNIYANGDRSSIDDPEYISITGFLLR